MKLKSGFAANAATIAAAGLLLAAAGSVSAQTVVNYPTKPVRVISSSSPGNSAEPQMRAISAKLTEIWGQPVVIEFIAGGDGVIGRNQAARAAPDGYTMLATGAQAAVLRTIFKLDNVSELGYDPVAGFRWVTNAVANPQMLTVRPGVAKTFAEYIALVKAKDGGLPFANIGRGGIAHILNEMISQQTGTTVNYINYRGGGPANIAMLGGHVDAQIHTQGGVQFELVKQGKIVPLAVSSKERSKGLPKVPTMTEVGLKGIQISSWQGYAVPSKTPDVIVNKMYEGFSRVLKDPAVIKYLEEQGFTVVNASPVETARQIEAEAELFKRVIKSAGITSLEG